MKVHVNCLIKCYFAFVSSNIFNFRRMNVYPFPVNFLTIIKIIHFSLQYVFACRFIWKHYLIILNTSMSGHLSPLPDQNFYHVCVCVCLNHTCIRTFCCDIKNTCSQKLSRICQEQRFDIRSDIVMSVYFCKKMKICFKIRDERISYQILSLVRIKYKVLNLKQ